MSDDRTTTARTNSLRTMAGIAGAVFVALAAAAAVIIFGNTFSFR